MRDNISRQEEYKMPLFYRFNTDQDFVTRDEMLVSLEMSLQDILSDFMRNVKALDLSAVTANELVWCTALSEYISDNEPRLLMPKVRILSYGKKPSMMHIEILAKLCFEDSLYTVQLKYN